MHGKLMKLCLLGPLLFLRNLNDTSRLCFLTNGLKLPFSSRLHVKDQKFVAVSMQQNLQNTTGSPGGDIFKRLKTFCFIRLVAVGFGGYLFL